MLNAYSIDKIVVSQSMGYDEWNEPQPDSETTLSGYVEYKQKLMISVEGEQISTSILIYIAKRQADYRLTRRLTNEDKIKSINDEQIDRAIITIAQIKAFSEPYYLIYLA